MKRSLTLILASLLVAGTAFGQTIPKATPADAGKFLKTNGYRNFWWPLPFDSLRGLGTGGAPVYIPGSRNAIRQLVAGTNVSLSYNATDIVINASPGAGGISTLNTLTASTQTFATGTSGSDFNISSVTSTHTFNLPTADATHTGKLSSTDWQTFNGKQAAITGAATTITSSNLTASRALVSDGSGKVAVSGATSTEVGYLSGVSSAIQTQIDGKLSTTGGTMTGDLSFLKATDLAVKLEVSQNVNTQLIWKRNQSGGSYNATWTMYIPTTNTALALYNGAAVHLNFLTSGLTQLFGDLEQTKATALTNTMEVTQNVSPNFILKRNQSGGSYNTTWTQYIPTSTTNLVFYNGAARLTLSTAGDGTFGGDVSIASRLYFKSAGAYTGGAYAILGIDAGSGKRFAIYDYNGGYPTFELRNSDKSATFYGKVNIGNTLDSQTDWLDVNADRIRVRSGFSPTSGTTDGYTGQISWGSGYLYVCITGDGPGGSTDTWQRVAMATW